MDQSARTSGAGKRVCLLGWAALLLLLAGGFLTTEFSISGSLEGIFLLRGRHKLLELRNDLFLDEQERLIFAVAFEPVWRFLKNPLRRAPPAPPALDYEWDDSEGSGFVLNRLRGEAFLLTHWSRFLDDVGQAPSGLFLGGGLPFSLNKPAEKTLNDTGMTYFDGQRWFHGWCNINELITSASAPEHKIRVSEWEYLDSRVLDAADSHLLITSRHRVRIGGAPVLIQKWVFFRAGDLYLTLATRFQNESPNPVAYYYLYGDEPWVGNYGTSRGNVGWTRDGLVLYEGFVDTAANDFIGFYDVGNSAIGEQGPFTRTANFLQWFGPRKPDLAYFTNMAGPLRTHPARTPLAARRSRALFLQWGPEALPPGGSQTYLLALGLIPGEPAALLPAKPPVALDPRLLKYLVRSPTRKKRR